MSCSTKSLESEELINVIEAVEMIKFTLKLFEEMNNDEKIDNLIQISIIPK